MGVQLGKIDAGLGAVEIAHAVLRYAQRPEDFGIVRACLNDRSEQRASLAKMRGVQQASCVLNLSGSLAAREETTGGRLRQTWRDASASRMQLESF